MKTRGMQIWFGLLMVVALAAGTLGPVAARDTQAQAAGEPVLLRLKYATFDPLQGEPQIDSALRADAYPGTGEGAYIVQFRGPVQGAWKDQVRALGGRVMDYLPDYAFLVWMDSAVQKRVAALDAVRWVGLYQPAYKLSPNLDRTKPIYRVVLFEGADLGAVAGRLAGLNTPTREVPGEQFALFLPEGGVDQVAAWPEALWIENRPLYQVTNNIATGIMGASTAWGNGYSGTGQMVTVADTGIDTGTDGPAAGDIHLDFDNRMAHISSWPVDASWAGCAANVSADDGPADVDSGHGTHVLGSVLGNGAASLPVGTIKGTAYTATPTFQAVEQWTTWTGLCALQYSSGYYITGLPLDIKTLFQEAYSWGSRIHSNSWGAPEDGAYTDDSQAVDQFVWDHPDMLIVFSAGNAGTDKKATLGYVDEDSLDAPGTAKNALTVGASDNLRDTGGYNPGGPCSTWGTCWPSDFAYNPTRDDRISNNSGELAAFSARGPANDGRRKPDVVAPGTNILSTRSSVASGSGWGLYPTDPDYLYMGGTSMATPLTAGAAAVVRQYYVQGLGHATPSAALIKATLINSAVDMAGYGVASQEAGLPIPNNHEGWGRVNVGAATSGGRQFEDADSVRTGTNVSYTYQIGSSATPFKVTLVWSDYPGSPSSGGLVDNLDLVVTAPDGTTTYRGNVFSGGWSVTGGTADSLNNVESVYIQTPAVGTWTVRVDGTNVPAPGNQQPFAVVATGTFGPPQPPVAAFSGSPLSGEMPLDVSLTDLSTGEITGWAWDFGDSAGTSTLPDPTYTYTSAGDYTVSLTVTGPGGSDTETKTNYIHVTAPEPAVADFSGSPTTGKAPLMVQFTDLSTGSVSAWSWSFGDGDSSAEQNPTHVYADVGDHTVTLTVTGTLGSDSKTVTNYIHVSEPAARIHLPLVMKGYTPPPPLENGDFEAGPWQGWIEYSSNGFQIVMHANDLELVPHSGVWAAWLGGAKNETAYIEQPADIALGRHYLHYWQWRAASTFDCNADKATLLINGAPVKTYSLCVSTNTGRWVESVVDLGAYGGQTVSLRFLTETSPTTASSWYIDDVSLEFTSAVSDAGIPAAFDPSILNVRKTKIAPTP
jgi:serine protease AprX